MNCGYSGILAGLFPLLDDAFGRKPRITFGLSSENPALFELDSMSDGSICSFIDFKSFKGWSFICQFSVFMFTCFRKCSDDEYKFVVSIFLKLLHLQTVTEVCSVKRVITTPVLCCQYSFSKSYRYIIEARTSKILPTFYLPSLGISSCHIQVTVISCQNHDPNLISRNCP